MTKNSFVLQTRLNGLVAKLSDKQAGALFKSILDYAENGAVALFEDSAVAFAFEMIRQDIDYAAKRYAETCARRAESGRLGGQAKQANLANASKCYKTLANSSKGKHNDNDNDVDNDIKQQLLTADHAAGKALSKPKRPLNGLQEFSNKVIEQFEQEVKTPEQKRIWFKRNCRNLTDILKYCGGDQVLALGCISACAARLEKAGLSGGYEAVCRNLPDYFAQAKKLQEVGI